MGKNKEALVKSLIDTMYLSAMTLMEQSKEDPSLQVYSRSATFRLPKEVIDEAMKRFVSDVRRSCLITGYSGGPSNQFAALTNTYGAPKTGVRSLDELLSNNNIIVVAPSILGYEVVRSISEDVDLASKEFAIIVLKYSDFPKHGFPQTPVGIMQRLQNASI